jgi:cytochrome c
MTPTGEIFMNRTALALIILATTCGGIRAQDVEAGKAVFAQCRICHQVGEGAKNVVGPQLNGIFGRTAGTVPGFSYSTANKQSAVVWDDSVFTTYIKDPKAFMPGNKMVYAGLKDEKKIVDLIAYLKSFGPDGKPAR